MSKCPICGARTEASYRPFCSRRCADIDLGKWMSGSYAVPSAEPLEPDEYERALEEERCAGGVEGSPRKGRLH
ncbi:DNA gyrase inhibitor YacG [Chachezhania sediminis]|uniref:DNA gyrase inhibitor YacG n=1 Tax=Chachezhania sediminis TaxID=2599291 RepID=UPI00131C60FD|nr:DNA gyrase inhibitor YacG [Chachezhania sediminis]